MKQILIVVFLLVTVAAKSQDTVKLPAHVAKQVVKDLVVCDSVKAEHEITKQLLILAEKESSAQNIIIDEYKKKTLDFLAQISAEEQKTAIWQDQYKDLAKKNKRLKTTLTITRITLTGIIGFLGYLYITK